MPLENDFIFSFYCLSFTSIYCVCVFVGRGWGWEDLWKHRESTGEILHRCVNISLSFLLTSIQLKSFFSPQPITAARALSWRTRAFTEAVKLCGHNRWKTMKVNHQSYVAYLRQRWGLQDVFSCVCSFLNGLKQCLTLPLENVAQLLCGVFGCDLDGVFKPASQH